MPRLTTRRAWLLATLAGVMAIAAYVLVWTQPLAPLAVEKLRIALPNVPHAGLLQIAVDRGYFVEAGLDVTIVPASHGKAALEELRQGKADLAAAADVPVLLALLRGEPLAIAASVLSVSNDHAIIARRDRNILAPGDLAGKKLGVSFGTSGEYFLWAYQVRHKLVPDAVKLVGLPPGRIAAALASAEVDAIATWSPITAAAQNALGEGAVVFTEANAYTLNFLLVGHADFIKGHPQAMEKLLRALLKAEEFNRSQPQQALSLVAAWLRVDIEALQPNWQHFNFRIDLRQSLLLTLEDQVRWAMARGYVARGALPNLLPYFTLDALLAERPERISLVH